MEITANAPVLDIAIPVHNEQHTLERCIHTLHGFLNAYVPYTFRITVADTPPRTLCCRIRGEGFASTHTPARSALMAAGRAGLRSRA